jgi:hypothetical protein
LRALGVLAFASLVACVGSSDELAPPRLSFDACGPVALVTSAQNDVQQAGLAAAEDLWRQRGAPALGRAGQPLEVRFQPAAAAFHGFYDDEAGVIYVNSEIASASVLQIVIAHELGHAFGLPHVREDDRTSVMNPGNLSTPPNVDDQRAIEALWGVCD